MWIISDIDGTLLSEPDRSPWSSAWCARVAAAHQVVLASSRTVAEVRNAQRLLEWSGAMIAEDGAVLVDQNGTVSLRGTPVDQLWRLVDSTTAGRLVRDGAATAPPGAQDRLASILIPAGLAATVAPALGEIGLSVARGGNWATISQGSDKGATAAYLIDQQEVGYWVAIGNGPNDAPLLRQSGYSFVIRNAEGHDPVLKSIPGAVLLTRHGPSGWDEMLSLLDREECPDVRSTLDDDRPDHPRAGRPSP